RILPGRAAGLPVHNDPVAGSILDGPVSYQIQGQPVPGLHAGDVRHARPVAMQSGENVRPGARRDRLTSEERPGAGRLRGNHTLVTSRLGALSVTKDTPWDHGLRVTAEADGLAGHAGAVLLRKLADQVGLTAALGAALARAGKFPLIDRGIALVSMTVAIALGATSMSDIALLAHQEPVFGPAPSDTTVRRTLELASPASLDKIARARARVRDHVWKLIAATPAGFPWLAIAGKLLAGWLVIDLDGTLITAHSDKQGAAPTFKKGYGLLTELRAESSQFSGHYRSGL